MNVISIDIKKNMVIYKSKYRWWRFKIICNACEFTYSLFSFSKTINLNKRKIICIPPEGNIKLKIIRVHSGDYTININHKSDQLFGLRKGGFIVITTAGKKLTIPFLAKTRSGNAFSYIGSGYTTGDNYSQFINFTVTRNVISLDLNVHNALPLQVELKIDVTCKNNLKINETSDACFDQSVVSWIKDNSLIKTAEAIVYADINLNIADGSSVWFSSMVSALSLHCPVVVVSKASLHSRIITSNFTNAHNVFILTPEIIQEGKSILSVTEAVKLIRILDSLLPKISRIVVRGLSAAKTLHETRQFRERSLTYLTDFYTVVNGEMMSTHEQINDVALVILHSDKLLIQTKEIEKRLAEIARLDFDSISFPPPIPDELPICRKSNDGTDILIGYAGKIAPNWGIEELLSWSQKVNLERKIQLKIVANKISSGGTGGLSGDFSSKIRKAIIKSEAQHFQTFNRQQSMELMAKMDYVWCWRPADFEENTMELSTKLVEMVAAGARCICYPSAINIDLLGADYPFFVRTIDDFQKIFNFSSLEVDASIIKIIKNRHLLSNISKNLILSTQPERKIVNARNILIAAHDFKFIDPFYTYLKKIGHFVQRDEWGWGEPKNIKRTEKQLQTADIVFCEWGLANAVWYSHNKRVGARLYIRMHLQEISSRARKFGNKINIDNVDKVIFVQEEVRREAIRLWNWPRDKTCLIPNFILSDEYRPLFRDKTAKIRLGLVGMCPQRKRFDRAVNVLSTLLDKGLDATLSIKGPRPESISFMQAPNRVRELAYYQQEYDRISLNKELHNRINFEGWGNNVALWYQHIDYILSPSDFESFHYALADGVLAGCHPIVWPWEGAATAYNMDWIIDDDQSAVERILEINSLSDKAKLTRAYANRNLLIQRYGHQFIFDALEKEMNLT